jgi:hypothetical protein
MLGHGDCDMGYDKCSVGRLMSTKLEHSRSNSNKTNQLVLANLEHSKSNSNKTSQLCICFELWPLWPWKVGQIKKPVYYVMYPCTYDKNLEMIQPLVQELYQFLVFYFCFGQESDWTEIWSVRYYYIVVHMYKVHVNSLVGLPGGHIWSPIGPKFRRNRRCLDTCTCSHTVIMF